MNNLITVKQLPIIEEQLKAVKEQAESKVKDALALACTEETVKQVKEVRTGLNKEFKELEDSRKAVKNQILAPYEAFEGVYKDCVSNIYKPADDQLKQKIADVENGLKDEKKEKVIAYFEEYAQSKNIDFVKFGDANINVTLTASLKSLKDQAKTFIDKISDDIALINTQENDAEIMFEYKRTFNVSQAITTVVNRHKAIEQEQAKAEQAKVIEVQRQAVVEKPIETQLDTEDDFFNIDFSKPIAGKVETSKHLLQVECTSFMHQELIKYMESHNIDFMEV